MNPEVMPKEAKSNGNGTADARLSTQEAGRFPALRSQLRRELESHRNRQEAAISKIIKTVAAESEFLEGLARQSEQKYQDTVDFHRKMGS